MFELVEMSYGTTRDYVRYCEEYPGFVREGVPGDPKDVQRPWRLETVNEYLSKGGRTLDLGGARCQLATRDHRDLVEAIHEVLASRGYSIHAIVLICRGVKGFFESQMAHSQSWLMYQSWRREEPYNEYHPWRQGGTLNMVARRKD